MTTKHPDRLQLRLIHSQITLRHDARSWLVTMTYMAARIDAAGAAMGTLYIAGVQPEHLYAVRVGDRQQAAFNLESMTDRIGRTVTAGECIRAMYGCGSAECLCICSADYAWALPLAQARIDLRVHSNDNSGVAGIQVFCEQQ